MSKLKDSMYLKLFKKKPDLFIIIYVYLYLKKNQNTVFCIFVHYKMDLGVCSLYLYFLLLHCHENMYREERGHSPFQIRTHSSISYVELVIGIYQIVFGRVHKNLNGKKNSSRNNRLQRNGNHAIFYSTLENDKLLDSPSKGRRGYACCKGFPK